MTWKLRGVVTALVCGALVLGCDGGKDDDAADSGAQDGGTAAAEGGTEEGGAAEEGGVQESGAEEGEAEEGGAESGATTHGGEEGGCGLDEGGDDAEDDADCPAEEGGAEEGEGTGSETGGEAGHCGLYFPDWACADGTSFESFSCGTPAVCGHVSASNKKFGEPGINAPENLQCIIESLRDGEAGTHTLRLDTEYNAYSEWEIESLGDGTVVVYQFEAEDKCADHTESWSYLKDASYFEGCLELVDDFARLNCVVDAATLECVDAEPVC